ncbi:MAG: septation protein SpoVG family protein [Planctomycetes bacterium]|nr:septation protein SpoVG family protein [Planctomycetota bacterium]
MKITEVKIKLVERQDDKLLAFASVTFDGCFVVRDIKIIQGTRGLFVAMPSRKITDRCHDCSGKNHLQALFCNQCGKRLGNNRSHTDGRGRAKLHADIAHPINSRYRTELQTSIISSYSKELERSRLPGYVPTSFDDLDAGPEGIDFIDESAEEPPRPSAPKAELPDQDHPPDTPAEQSPAGPSPKPGTGDGGGLGIFS